MMPYCIVYLSEAAFWRCPEGCRLSIRQNHLVLGDD